MIDPWGLWGSLFSDPDITGCNCSWRLKWIANLRIS
jgi:hypothetical protein